MGAVVNSSKHRREREKQKEQPIVEEKVKTGSKHGSLMQLVRCLQMEQQDLSRRHESEELFWIWTTWMASAVSKCF